MNQIPSTSRSSEIFESQDSDRLYKKDSENVFIILGIATGIILIIGVLFTTYRACPHVYTFLNAHQLTVAQSVIYVSFPIVGVSTLTTFIICLHKENKTRKEGADLYDRTDLCKTHWESIKYLLPNKRTLLYASMALITIILLGYSLSQVPAIHQFLSQKMSALQALSYVGGSTSALLFLTAGTHYLLKRIPAYIHNPCIKRSQISHDSISGDL